jgi:hypothetical protein
MEDILGIRQGSKSAPHNMMRKVVLRLLWIIPYCMTTMTHSFLDSNYDEEEEEVGISGHDDKSEEATGGGKKAKECSQEDDASDDTEGDDEIDNPATVVYDTTRPTGRTHHGHFAMGVESFLEWIEANPVGGIFVFMLVYFVVAKVLFVPGSILTLGAGFFFASAVGLGVGVLLGLWQFSLEPVRERSPPFCLEDFYCENNGSVVSGQWSVGSGQWVCQEICHF